MDDDSKRLDNMPYDKFLEEQGKDKETSDEPKKESSNKPDAKSDASGIDAVEQSGGEKPYSPDVQLSENTSGGDKKGKRMSTSEFGAAAKVDDTEPEQGKDDTGVASDANELSEGAPEGGSIASTMKNILGKGKMGIKGLFQNLAGSFGAAAAKLNMSVKLLTVISVLLGGSAASILGMFLFTSDNVGKYLPETDCRVNALPYEQQYTDNETMPAWTQDNMDAAAHTIYQMLTDKTLVNGVISQGDHTLESEEADTEFFHYALPKNLRGQSSVDSSKAHTSSSLSDWTTVKVNHEEGSSNTTSDKVYNRDIGFTDEAILGMIAAAQAESGLNANMWEGYTGCWYYATGGGPDVPGSEIPDAPSSGGSTPGGKDLVMCMSHHRDWSSYVQQLEKWWSDQGVTINLSAYTYTDNAGSTTNAAGKPHYYPGVGLWQWTGARAYALQEWSNMLENVTDSNLDGANDAMYGLNQQIYYLLFENLPAFNSNNAGPKDCGGTAMPIRNGDNASVLTGGYTHLIDWGVMARGKYTEKFYANVTNKPAGAVTEKLGGRSRVPIPVNNSGSSSFDRTYRNDDEIIMPVVDYVYKADGTRKINQDALDMVWQRFKELADDVDDLCYLSAYNNETKIKMLMTTHYIPNSIPPTIWWHPFTELDLLDVGRTGLGGHSWGATMEENDMGEYYYKKDLSIYETRVYYDVSVEVMATYSDGTIMMGPDGNNGLRRDTTRPDMGVYGSTPGNGIIYESTFENMTGYIASDSTSAGYGNKYNIFRMSGSASADEHSWAGGSTDYLLKMGRTNGQWGDYGQDTAHGVVTPSEFPGWTDSRFNAWWNKDSYSSGYHARKTVGNEYDDIYYRIKLASSAFEGPSKSPAGHPIRSIVTEIGAEGSQDYEFCKQISDELTHWAEIRALAQVSRIAAREFTQRWEGGTEVGQLNQHSQYGSLVHYATMIIENEWERNDNVSSSMLDMWYENMSSAQLNEWWHSFYRNYCGNDVGFGGIAEMAVAMAWPKGHEDLATENELYSWGSGNYARTLCTELYCAIKCIVGPDDGAGNAQDWTDGSKKTSILFSSCDRGVCTSVRSAGADDNFPWGACKTQVAYVKAHPEKWECLGLANSLWDEMQPGDLLLSDHHVVVFVGPQYPSEKWGDDFPEFAEENCKYAICHSSYSGDLPSSRGLRCDPDGRAGVNASNDFYVYRLVGEPDASSIYKTRVEGEKNYLNTLKNGT